MKRILVGADRGDGLIGLWWYTDDKKVIGVSEPVDDGRLDGNYIQCSSGNHLSRWSDVISEFIPEGEREAIISKGFKSLYLGRVIYDTLTSCYIITCSEDLKNDTEFRSKVIEYFQLSNCNRQFQSLDHYKYKNALTRDPAVDEHYLDI